MFGLLWSAEQRLCQPAPSIAIAGKGLYNWACSHYICVKKRHHSSKQYDVRSCIDFYEKMQRKMTYVGTCLGNSQLDIHKVSHLHPACSMPEHKQNASVESLLLPCGIESKHMQSFFLTLQFFLQLQYMNVLYMLVLYSGNYYLQGRKQNGDYLIPLLFPILCGDHVCAVKTKLDFYY